MLCKKRKRELCLFLDHDELKESVLYNSGRVMKRVAIRAKTEKQKLNARDLCDAHMQRGIEH